MVYKPCRIHFVPDHLSQIGHGELVIGIKGQLLDATLFIISPFNYHSKLILKDRREKL
jgi:hypothetical protein